MSETIKPQHLRSPKCSCNNGGTCIACLVWSLVADVYGDGGMAYLEGLRPATRSADRGSATWTEIDAIRENMTPVDMAAEIVALRKRLAATFVLLDNATDAAAPVNAGAANPVDTKDVVESGAAESLTQNAPVSHERAPDAVVISEGMDHRAMIDRLKPCPVGTKLYAAPIETSIQGKLDGSAPSSSGEREDVAKKIINRIERARDDFPVSSDKWLGVQRALMDARAEYAQSASGGKSRARRRSGRTTPPGAIP